MNVLYAVHDASGRILRHGQCHFQITELQARPGETAIILKDEICDEKHWVDSGEVKERQQLPMTFDKVTIFADGKDVAKIDGLPKGTVVSVDGVNHVVDDGVFELVSPLAATYETVVSAWPFFDKKILVKAV